MIIGNKAKLIRSKNAGPFIITIDIIFENNDDYIKIEKSKIFNERLLAEIYNVKRSTVKIFRCDEINTIKISFNRTFESGNVKDTDIFGGQMHGPLVDLAV